MDDYLDELHKDIERVIDKMSGAAHDLVLMGAEVERIEFFEHLRELIAEKDLAGDQIAVEVLSWAYEKLADSCS
jgi:hypothetical protein